MTFRIAQISDTHLSRAKPFFLDNFACVARHLAADPPDLVVNSGDVSLDGAHDAGDLACARDLHAGLPAEWRCIPGNHDLGDNADVAGHGAHHASIDAAARGRYLDHFGPDWWQLDVPGWRIIGLNAQLAGSGLPEAAAQEAFLAQAAAGAQSPILLFIHKPLFDASPAETAIGGRFLNPAPRARLLAAMGNRLPAVVACGHVHQFRLTESAGTRCVWAPSTAYSIPDRIQPRYGRKQTGYVEHLLHEDGRHEARMVRPAGIADLDLGDFPQAYGAIG